MAPPFDRLRERLAGGGLRERLAGGGLRERLRDRLAGGTGSQLLRFGVIGALSAAAYLVLYVALRGLTGPQVANVVALLLSQVANTAVNRRLTFGVRGQAGALRHQAGGLAAFAVGLGLTAGALALLHRADPGAGRGAEVVVLVAANVVATAVRFLTLRRMMAPRGRGRPV